MSPANHTSLHKNEYKANICGQSDINKVTKTILQYILTLKILLENNIMIK